MKVIIAFAVVIAFVLFIKKGIVDYYSAAIR